MKNTNGIVLGLIPARGGSKGIPGKNIRLINNKPLIAYSIECGLLSPSIDRLILSTDNETIAEVAKKYGAEVPFLRPSELATDDAPTMPVIEHAIIKCETYFQKMISFIVLLEPTAPLRILEDIENAINLFQENDCDAVLSAHPTRANPYFKLISINNHFYEPFISAGEQHTRRQDAPIVFELNPAVWVYSRKAVMEEKSRIPKRSIVYQVPAERSLDIDTENDLQYLEFLLQKRK